MAENFEPFRGLPKAAQWGVLVAISIVLIALLKLVQLPAALLLGPMIAAILLETGGGAVRVPRLPFRFAQAVIGCLVAETMTGAILARFGHQWPLFLSVMVAVIAASAGLGFTASKFGLLPGTTGIWGILPGAASVMMLVAEEFGADARLVAFMQYLRVVCVALAAAMIARVWIHVTGHLPPTVWFPEIHGVAFAETLGVVLFGVVLGPRLRIPAGGVLVPMILGTALHIGGIVELQLPPWFLAASYLMLGWNIGLRFTRGILVHAFRALPQIFGMIAAMMIFCGLLACLLVREVGIDPLTAYLATSPGGIDSAAVIAASTKVDMPFVMSLQIMRFIMVLLVGPPLSRWLAGMFTRGPEESAAEAR